MEEFADFQLVAPAAFIRLSDHMPVIASSSGITRQQVNILNKPQRHEVREEKV